MLILFLLRPIIFSFSIVIIDSQLYYQNCTDIDVTLTVILARKF